MEDIRIFTNFSKFPIDSAAWNNSFKPKHYLIQFRGIKSTDILNRLLLRTETGVEVPKNPLMEAIQR